MNIEELKLVLETVQSLGEAGFKGFVVWSLLQFLPTVIWASFWFTTIWLIYKLMKHIRDERSRTNTSAVFLEDLYSVASPHYSMDHDEKAKIRFKILQHAKTINVEG